MAQREETVVLFPFMAEGHMNQFLAMALQIEQKRGCRVIFVNTPLNIRKLKSSLPPNTTSIQLVELPFCSSDHNLPPDSEKTDVLPYPLIIRLFEASLSLKPFFRKLISDIKNQQQGHPLCIISDVLFGWTVEIANEFDIFHSISTAGAYGFGVYFSLWLTLPHFKTDSDEFMLPDFHKDSRFHRTQLASYLRDATGDDPWSVFIQRELSLCFNTDGILLNTVEELDRIGLDYFRRKTGGPVWAIGPVDYSLTQKARQAKKPGIDLEQCIKWLDAHPPGSVLYVSFGSQNTISSSQLMELAIGLEASGRNFIWVIRPPIGFDINGEFKSEWLPEGFEGRTTEHSRGLLVHKWAPQLEILSHKSTCAFLSHCGWNSTLESLNSGVPIIGWPLAAEQFYNTKLLEEVGVCVEIARGSDSEIKHEDVVRVIDLVMSETEKGEEMRKKAIKVREMIKNATREDADKGFKGSSVKAMEEFLDTALSNRKTKSDQRNKV